MIKSFALCSLPDLALEISLAIALKIKSNSKTAATAAELLPCFTNTERTEGVLQHHPLVRNASGLVCSDTTESEEAWRAMLRDLCGAGVTDSVFLFLYSVCRECACRGIVRAHSNHPFLAGVAAHPAFELCDPAFMFELIVHPAHCLASRRSLERLEFMLKRKCAPSQACLQQWNAVCIGIRLKQQRALLCSGALFSALVLKLLCFQSKRGAEYPMIPAESIVTRFHFLGSKKNQGDRLFEEGVRLYGEQRFSDSAKSWGHAALLRHGPSHAHLSSMMFEGREGVPFNKHRAFQLASAGVVLGCVHSKGALGRCYISDLFQDVAKGLALARESAAAGSCFGQNVVAWCYLNGLCVEADSAEAIRLFRLAAAQGYVLAQNNVGFMLMHVNSVAQDNEEAVRMLRLAAAQGNSHAQNNLGVMHMEGRGLARDDAEAVRLFRVAAGQGLGIAQYNLGFMFEHGRSVAKDQVEAARQYHLAAGQGVREASAALTRWSC